MCRRGSKAAREPIKRTAHAGASLPATGGSSFCLARAGAVLLCFSPLAAQDCHTSTRHMELHPRAASTENLFPARDTTHRRESSLNRRSVRRHSETGPYGFPKSGIRNFWTRFRYFFRSMEPGLWVTCHFSTRFSRFRCITALIQSFRNGFQV